MTKLWGMLTAAFGLGFAFVPPASAQWVAHASRADVFGNITVDAVSMSSSGDGLVIQCNQKDSLKLAYIFPATQDDVDKLVNSDEPLSTELLIKVDQTAPRKLSANLKAWNDHYVGFVVSGRKRALVKVIQAIGRADSSVDVGVDLDGHQQTDSFNAGGSTSAMTTVIKDCKLDDIKGKQTSADAKSQ